MNNKFKNIFIVLIVLSGLFCFGGAWDAYTLKFNFQNQNNSFYVAQLSFFWLITGLFGAYLVYTKNKYMGAMVALLSFGLFKTFLCDHAPKTYMYESALIGYSFFIIYYFIRHFEFKENMLKWLMIPASINIFIVFIQAFDKSPIPFLNTSQVSGLLGNEGMAGVYLGLISIVFLKYWKLGYAVICPHTNTAFMDGIGTDDMFLIGDHEIIRRVDVAVVMKGWEESKGSVVEVELCKKLNKEIIYENTKEN